MPPPTPLDNKLASIHRSVSYGGTTGKDNHILVKVVYDKERLSAVGDQDDEKLPIVIFLNGADCPHESYMWLASRLARAGYCVVLSSCVMSMGPASFLLSHTFDMSMLQTVQGYKAGPSNEGIAAIINGVETLNQETTSPLVNKLDMKRIVMGGHSAGGRTVLDLVAFDNPFPNIVAAFAYGSSLVVSGAPFAPTGTIIPPEATNPPPLLLLGGSEDGISAGLSATSDPTETLRRSITEGFVKANGDVDLIIFNGSNHMVFSTPLDPTCGAVAKDRPLQNKSGEHFRHVMGNVILEFLTSRGLDEDFALEEQEELTGFQPRVPASMIHTVESVRPKESSTPDLSIIDSELEEQELVWNQLSSALEEWISKIVSSLELEPSTKLADDVRQWTSSSNDINLQGTLAAWESPLVVWAVKYSNKLVGDDSPQFSKSLGFNVWLDSTSDAPHLTVHVGVRGNRATLMGDLIPRFDLVLNPQHLETYYGGDRSYNWSAIQKSNTLDTISSIDPNVRAIQSPNSLALCTTLEKNNEDAIETLVDVLDDHVSSWMSFVNDAKQLSNEEANLVEERDEAVRKVLCHHEQTAGEQVMDPKLARVLANTMAGFDN